MTYWEGVLSRLDVPGLVLLLLGAVVGYGSKPIMERVFHRQGQKGQLVLKAAGCALALLGALLLLDIL